MPQFRYGQKGSGGVGQGDGEPGQPLDRAAGRRRSAAPAISRAATSSKSN